VRRGNDMVFVTRFHPTTPGNDSDGSAGAVPPALQMVTE
jgi:hypothetical protein